MMDELDKLTNKCRKEMFLLRKKRQECSAKRKSRLTALLPSDTFYIMNCEEAHAIWLNYSLSASSVGCQFNDKNTDIKRVSIYTDASVDLENRIVNFDYYLNDSIYLFPMDWEYFGGLIIQLSVLLHNFTNLSYIVEDDFIGFDKSMQNVFQFMGERSGSEDSFSGFELKTLGTLFAALGE